MDWWFRLVVGLVTELDGLFVGLLVGLEVYIGNRHLPDTPKELHFSDFSEHTPRVKVYVSSAALQPHSFSVGRAAEAAAASSKSTTSWKAITGDFQQIYMTTTNWTLLLAMVRVCVCVCRRGLGACV